MSIFLTENYSDKKELNDSLYAFLAEEVFKLHLNEVEDDDEEVEYDEYYTGDEDFDDEELSEEDLSQFKVALQEAPLTTSRKVVVKTAAQKKGSLTQKAAMKIAAQKKDPMFTAYMKARKLEITLRKKIEKKYSSSAKSSVNQYLQGRKPPKKR